MPLPVIAAPLPTFNDDSPKTLPSSSSPCSGAAFQELLLSEFPCLAREPGRIQRRRPELRAVPFPERIDVILNESCLNRRV